jgi:catechol 2,3-dioxygenase-like lactoylglutathione lyase family enzyme
MMNCHLLHINWAASDNAKRKACDRFFLDVFGAQTGHEMLYTSDADDAGVDREESLMVVSDIMLIPIAACGTGLNANSEIGSMLQFHARAGMWIGIALEVDSIYAADAWMRQIGFEPHYRPGAQDKYFVLNRNETLGLRLEFITAGVPSDPRQDPLFDLNWWRDQHPLGIEKLQSVGLSVDALDQARDLYVGKFGWREISRRALPIDGANCAAFLVGDAIVEAMEPSGADSALARHRRDIQGIYSLTFKVRSAESAAALLKRSGFSLVGDEKRFAIEPSQAFDRLIYFTEDLIENDPRVS